MNFFLGNAYAQNFPVKDGKYFVHSTINYDYVWDMDPNSGNLHLWQKHGGANQQFIFKSRGDGIYKIFCAQNGKALDCQYSSQENGANVWLYPFNDSSAQHWRLKSRDLFKFSVFSEINFSKNPRCIDVTHSNAANGTNLWLYNNNGTAAQIWFAEPCN